MKQVARTFDLLTELERNFPNKEDMLCKKRSGQWIKYSVKDYVKYSHLIAYALNYLGYGNKDKAITICQNRPEWNFIDMGLNMANMVHIPVYPTLGNEDYLHIFNHSDSKIIFLDSAAMYNKIQPIVQQMEHPARIILIDNSEDKECLRDLYKIGEEHISEAKPKVDQIKESIQTDELASIIYTSGTT
jgi:long-chain acyl-CoA synthetase